MDIIDSKNDTELYQSIIAESAKATNEIRCAKADIEKATSRLKFLVMLANKLIERKGDHNGPIKDSD
jgi:hypothetical protein